MKRSKRTKKLYTDLYDKPTTLFPATVKRTIDVETTLFPNGERSIWLKTADGRGFRLEASATDIGLSLRVTAFVGTPAVTVFTPTHSELMFEDSFIELCQYSETPEAQSFKRAYAAADLDSHYKQFPEKGE